MIAVALGMQSCSDDFTQPPVPEPDGGMAGSGAWDNPMSAWQVYKSTLNPEYPNDAWMTGYIVGCIDTSVGFTLSEKTADFTAPFTVSSNLLLTWLTPDEFKAIPDSEKWEYVCSAQLQANTAARSAVNLVDNDPDEILYRQVCLQGETGRTYMGPGGIRSVINYNWVEPGEEPVGIAPEAPVLPAATGAFYQNFQKYNAFSEWEKLGWWNVIEKGKFAGWVTSTMGRNTYMAIDASLAFEFGGPYQASLLSPAINLEEVEEKTLSFDVQVVNQCDNSSLTVFVLRQNGEGQWVSETPLDVKIPAGPEKGFGEWNNVGKIDLSGFEGIIRIGWRYFSETGGMETCTTYCIDNVNVGNQPAPVVVDLGKDQISAMLNAMTLADGWTFDNVELGGGLSYVWSWNSSGYLNGSAFKGGAQPAVAYAISPVVSLKGFTGCNVVFDHAAKFQTTCRELCRFVVREAGTTEWTELEIPYWPTAGGWSFTTSGQIDITAFDGKDVEIGFKYVSTAEGADTWEIKNLQVLGFKSK